MSRFGIIVEFELLEGGFDIFHQEVLRNSEASKREEPGCQTFGILVPNKEENRNGRPSPLTLAANGVFIGCGNASGGWLYGYRSLTVDRSLGESTLQTHHVRLDV